MPHEPLAMPLLEPPAARRALAGALLALAAGCLAPREGGEPGGDFITTVYLTEEEALDVVFPEAARVVADDLVLTAEEHARAEAFLSRPLRLRRFHAHLGVAHDGSLDGYALILSEIGKFKPFTFIVGIEPDGSVRRVAVLVYREARGGEVARRRFLSQYPGKTAADPLDKNRDIINIQGATMSVDALNHGVKTALAVVEAAYRSGGRRVEDALERSGRTQGSRENGTRGDETPGDESAPPAGAALHHAREARYVMGALCEIQAFGADPVRLRDALRAAFAEIEACDRALSDYRPGSELSTASREAWRRPLPVSALTAEFLRAGERLARASGGAFDLTIGPAVDAWGFHGESGGRVPAPREIEALRGLIGHEKVVLEPLAGGGEAVRLARQGMRLDPGGLGKGFALERAAERLRAAGASAALLDFSSTARALGAPPAAGGWTIAVRDPADPGAILGLVELRDAALAASGSAERHFVRGGRRAGHIISPFRLEPVSEVLGAVVVAPTATDADGYATAACVLGEDAIPLLEALPGVEGLVVLEAADGGLERRETRGVRLEPAGGPAAGLLTVSPSPSSLPREP
jgi:thiamine biosynthesis lipoprotein ApbE